MSSRSCLYRSVVLRLVQIDVRLRFRALANAFQKRNTDGAFLAQTVLQTTAIAPSADNRKERLRQRLPKDSFAPSETG